MPRSRRLSVVLGVLSVALTAGAVVTVATQRTGADKPPSIAQAASRAPQSPGSRPATSAPSTSAPEPTPERVAPAGLGALRWSDDFDGPAGSPVSSSRWKPTLGGNGFGNQELECNTDKTANSALDGDGNLVITAVRDPGHVCSDGAVTDYTSARLSTADLATVRYGQVRVRAQLPSASGLWPAIWALGADHESVGWPQSGEVDIAEGAGQTPDTVYQTIHGPSYAGTPYSLHSNYSIGQPLSAGFHTYGVDWSPDRLTFSVDGDTYASFTRNQVQTQGSWVFDQPFYLLLDVAVGGNFPGPPQDQSVFPQRMLVDYVRVYS